MAYGKVRVRGNDEPRLLSCRYCEWQAADMPSGTLVDPRAEDELLHDHVRTQHPVEYRRIMHGVVFSV